MITVPYNETLANNLFLMFPLASGYPEGHDYVSDLGLAYPQNGGGPSHRQGYSQYHQQPPGDQFYDHSTQGYPKEHIYYDTGQQRQVSDL